MSLPNRPTRIAAFTRKQVIFDVVVISTAHVKENDGALMLDPKVPYLEYIAGGGYASAFSIPESETIFNLALADWKHFGFTDAFLDVMRELQAMGVQTVLFDCDGPVNHAWPIYEW